MAYYDDSQIHKKQNVKHLMYVNHLTKTVVNRREVHNTDVHVNRVDNLPGCWWRNFLYTPIFLLSSALTSPIVSNNVELDKQLYR